MAVTHPFSRRIPADLTPNALAAARARARVSFDLTASNPTEVGLPYPAGLLESLASLDAATYRPDPRGLPSARRAVAQEIARAQGVEIDPDRIVLTASTSEAYGLLLKLLADPGDGIAIPSPSYPLFDHLVRLEGLHPVVYPLDPADGWRPVPEVPADAAVRAWIAVHPNNPTGSYLDPEAALALARAAEAQGAALVVDEVFHAFPLDAGTPPPSLTGRVDVLTFTLGGLSKHAGLPQLKLAWIVVSGPARVAEAAIERLAFVADQYLSVGTPVQVALPSILPASAPVRVAILERCRGNLARLRALAARVPEVTVLRAEGGWSAVLRMPSVLDEDALVLRLLEEDGVAVHPGWLFDFPLAGHLVLGLLAPPERFEEGATRLLARVAAG